MQHFLCWLMVRRINSICIQILFYLGNYSCLVAQFYMKRSISFHLIQSYLPSILIVAISWVSFWMDLDSVPGRISLGVITMLAVSGQAGVGNINPIYIKNICIGAFSSIKLYNGFVWESIFKDPLWYFWLLQWFTTNFM